MSQVIARCPHLALSPIYTSLSFSLHLYLVLLWEITFKDSDNPASSSFFSTHENNSSTPPLVISRQCYWSFPLQVPLLFSPIFSNETQTLPVFRFPKSLLSVQSNLMDLFYIPLPFLSEDNNRWHTFILRLPCGEQESLTEFKGHKYNRETFVCLGYTVPITEQFNCLPVSPSQSTGVTKPFSCYIPPNHLTAHVRVWNNQPLRQHDCMCVLAWDQQRVLAE